MVSQMERGEPATPPRSSGRIVPVAPMDDETVAPVRGLLLADELAARPPSRPPARPTARLSGTRRSRPPRGCSASTRGGAFEFRCVELVTRSTTPDAADVPTTSHDMEASRADSSRRAWPWIRVRPVDSTGTYGGDLVGPGRVLRQIVRPDRLPTRSAGLGCAGFHLAGLELGTLYLYADALRSIDGDIEDGVVAGAILSVGLVACRRSGACPVLLLPLVFIAHPKTMRTQLP
jgi:hypothetical protein